MKADINKQNKQTQKAKEKRTLDSLSPMERGMKDLLKELFKPNKEFDEKKFFQIVTDYVNNYDRLLYSELSIKIRFDHKGIFPSPNRIEDLFLVRIPIQ